MITSIIPDRPSFIDENTKSFSTFEFNRNDELDLKAICLFTALGFFLGDTTYFKNLKVAAPATDYQIENDKIVDQKVAWAWDYQPRDISFKQAVDEFGELFESITKQQVEGRKVILPLSGGLDSRSQAAVLKGHSHVSAYSYEFENGIKENKYGKAIAKEMGYDYQAMTIPKGYLWDGIESLAKLNHCLSDFTHQRQMAVKDNYSAMGDLFFLGHWGDVLFDDMGVSSDLEENKIIPTLLPKIIKKGGGELAQKLWQAWGLAGDFESYLKDQLEQLIGGIQIKDANAKIRAFKSLYWAPRWTSTNLCVFQSEHEVALPYYHDDMCKFISTVPEKYLAARQIQIEYIKRKTPELASIPWQSLDPCNLYNYQSYYSIKYLPIRTLRKLRRDINEKLLGQSRVITRNWEIQFYGEENEKQLKNYLFDNSAFKEFVPGQIVQDIYDKFSVQDDVKYSHPLSMLLTLSLFSKLRNSG